MIKECLKIVCKIVLFQTVGFCDLNHFDALSVLLRVWVFVILLTTFIVTIFMVMCASRLRIRVHLLLKLFLLLNSKLLYETHPVAKHRHILILQPLLTHQINPYHIELPEPTLGEPKYIPHP